MSKDSPAVTESMIMRLCEWRGLNGICKKSLQTKRNRDMISLV